MALNPSEVSIILWEEEKENDENTNNILLESQLVLEEIEERLDRDFNNSSTSHESSILLEQNQNVSDTKKRKRRKISIEEKESDIRTENRVLRMQGKKYKGRSKTKDGTVWMDREARVLGPPCTSANCRKTKGRFCHLFTEDIRRNIFDEFWSSMNWAMKKVYIKTYIDMCEPKRKTKVVVKKDRNHTLSFFLRIQNNSRHQVCKHTFMSTLGINERLIRTVTLSSMDKLQREMSMETPEYHASKKLKPRRDHLKKFLEELPKLPSHYSRKTSTKLYLERSFTSVRHVYSVYSEDAEMELVEPLSRNTFRKAFKEANLSIFRPRKDRCDFCVSYEMNGTKITEEEYEEHVAREKRAQEEKRMDKENIVQGRVVLAVDVQAVLMAPKVGVSAMYYRMKLGVHNYTVYNIQNGEVMCYVWSEDEGGLDSSIFASMLVDKLETIVEENPDTTDIIIYSDGCPYQNRCVLLANAILLFSINSGVTVVQKYLEKGHTMMEVDSVHAVVENRLKKRDIEHPFDYVKQIVKGRQNKKMKPPPYEVKSIKHTFFKEYKGVSLYSSIRPGTIAGDKQVIDLRALMYLPSGEIKYKLLFTEDEWTPLPLKHKEKNPTKNIIPKYTERIPISADKYRHLQELKFCIDKKNWSFYDNLPHN